MTYGKHGGRGFVSRVRELPRGVAAAGIGLVAAGGLALGLTLSGFAGASVSRTVDYTTNGVAGAKTFGGQVTGVSDSIYIRAADANLPLTTNLPNSAAPAAVGDQICNNNTSRAAQLGYVRTGPTTYTVAYAVGTMPPGTNVDPCENGILTAGPDPIVATALVNVPSGVTLNFSIKESGRHNRNLTFSAQTASGTSVWSRFLPGAGFYATEAGAGIQGNISPLGGTPSVEMLAARGLTVSGAGGTGDFGTAGPDAALVFSSATGNPPPLVDSTLSGSVLKVYEAPKTGA